MYLIELNLSLQTDIHIYIYSVYLLLLCTLISHTSWPYQKVFVKWDRLIPVLCCSLRSILHRADALLTALLSLHVNYTQGLFILKKINNFLCMNFVSPVQSNLMLYVPCIMFRCVDKPTRCNTSYEWSLLSINWLYMFLTTTSPSSGVSSLKLYNALVCSCRRV